MSFITGMKCVRCGSDYSPNEKVCMCLKRDYGRLDIFYDYDDIIQKVSKKVLSDRQPGVWKYHELLPLSDQKYTVTLGEGATALLRANNLSEKIGLRNLLLKNETGNPSGSFKDRSMTVGVSKALEFGANTTVIASSGNAAASLAAYSAKARLKCFAFVLESASIAKITQIELYGANVVKVKAIEKGKDPTVQILLKIVEKYGWYPCPSFGPFNPYQVEGPKTISYEIIEQSNWIVPDWVIIPTGSGCLLTGIWKGFKDFQKIGLIGSLPKLAAIQPEGCAPVVKAYKNNKGPFEIEGWKKPSTIASGLTDVFPWDGDAAIVALREGGIAEAVSDEEIHKAQRLLASTEGIFAEPSGVASVAGLIKLLDQGIISRDEKVVVLITGTGLKDPEVVRRRRSKTIIIKPILEDFNRYVVK